MTNKYRTLNQVSEEYFTNHPEEINDYITEVFDEYAKSGDSTVLLSSLRVIARVKGVSKLAEEASMSRQGLQKALSVNGNPRLDNINSIMIAMGYKLTPQPLNQI